MWEYKHFKSIDAGMAWIARRSIQWERVFVENKAFSIMYRPLRTL